MLKVSAYALGTLGYLVAFISPAPAQPSTFPLLVSGEEKVTVDTNQNGRPDSYDGFCTAHLQGTVPVKPTVSVDDGLQVVVECSPEGDHWEVTGPTTSDGGLRALEGTYTFDVVSFDMMSSSAALHQTDGTNVKPNHFIDGMGFPGSGGGTGVTRVVEITNQSDGSFQGSGVLCAADGGPSSLVTLQNGMRVLRKLDLVDCDYYGCTSDNSPNFLRAPGVPFEEGFSKYFVMRDVYIPVMRDGSPKLTLSLSNLSDIRLGEIDLGALGACSTNAPAASGWGLAGLTLGLLTAGTWLMGRRSGFAQSLVRP